MDAIFKLIDKFTEYIPHSTMQMIRLGGVLVWLILGTIAIFYAWRAGSDSVPPSGQDLSQATVREKVERERNLQNPPALDLRARESVVIPDTREFQREGQPPIPYRADGRTETRPVANPSDPREPFSRERSSGAPYVGEDPSVVPNRGYTPPRDGGSSGTRDGRAGENESRRAPLLPPPGGEEPPRRTGPNFPERTQERAPEGMPQRSSDPGPEPRRDVKPPARGQGGRTEPSLYPRRKSGAPGLLPPASGGTGDR